MTLGAGLCVPSTDFRVWRLRKFFKVVVAHALDNEEATIFRSAIGSLMWMSSIDSIAFSHAQDTTIVRSARLHGQFALEHEKFVGDCAVKMPGNDLARREREKAHSNVLSRCHGLRV